MSHATQASPFEASLAVVYVPPMQRAQETLPSVIAYFPASQAAHTELRTDDAKVPFGHAEQFIEPVEEKVPATQGRQSLSVSCAKTEAPGSLRYFPAAQRVQFPDPGDAA